MCTFYIFQSLIEWQARRFFKMMLKMETFFEFLERNPKVDITTGKDKTEKLFGILDFKNVSFKYPTRPDSDVLKVRYFKLIFFRTLAFMQLTSYKSVRLIDSSWLDFLDGVSSQIERLDISTNS